MSWQRDCQGKLTFMRQQRMWCVVRTLLLLLAASGENMFDAMLEAFV